ncbi:hypothetical protein TRFO_21201 [Tritrichomonas foetus]|uniref:Uncharacterized protein n=1 Tax=Tritrichomonas foetus TaxID=1144522 RepID=A0A1J4KK97_9EUKA|nr:hypothetical protein TRFO_21201 [Tritrichomonas foetus]|eukprot:OHT09773.1 hypothetical protein TRFO_21201 [Tritrichomonas foetus]
MEEFPKAPSVASSRVSYRERSSFQANPIISATYDVIAAYNEDIEQLNDENMKIRTRVDKLESDLEAITQALNENIKAVEEFNFSIQAENDELASEIERIKALFEVVKPMIDQCLEINPEIFSENPNLNSLLGKVKGSKVPPNYEASLDPLLNKILPGMDYFKDCKTNAEFIQRCKIIINEIKRLEKNRGDNSNDIFESEYQKANVAVLRKQLRRVQGDKDVVHIDYSERIKELTDEKEKLLEEKRRLIGAQVSSRNESTQSPRKSVIIPKSNSTCYSPIRRRNQTIPSSPLKL